MELRDFVTTVGRRWKFVIVFLLVGLAASAWLTASMTPAYSATSRVFFSTQATTTADALQGGMFSVQRVTSYAGLVHDESVLNAVIQRLGLDETTSELAGQVEAVAEPTTVVIAITAKAPSSAEARQIAEAMSAEMIKLVARLERPDNAAAPSPIIARSVGKATYSLSPVSPNTTLNLAVGGVLGILVGLVGAIIRELLDTSVTSVQQAQDASGSTVLGTVPMDRAVSKSPLLDAEGSSREIAEAFRVLRTNLQFVNVDTTMRCVVISSAVPDEGKTLMSANLAVAMAANGLDVLLIDCDFRHPQMPVLLGLEQAVGLSTVLVGRAPLDEAVQHHASGFSFLATGRVPPNPAEVLQTQAMRDLIAEATADYDIVLIDAPPLLPVADAAILANQADGVLLVAAHGRTKREQLRIAAERVELGGGRVSGIVLNMVPKRRFGSYGYGYGYGYGDVPELPDKRAKKRDVDNAETRSPGRRAARHG